MIPKQLQEFAVALAFYGGREDLEVFIFTARGKFQARRKNSRFFLSASKADRYTGSASCYENTGKLADHLLDFSKWFRLGDYQAYLGGMGRVQASNIRNSGGASGCQGREPVANVLV
jgi:hypothetical protein